MALRCHVSACRGDGGAQNSLVTYRCLWLSFLTGRGRLAASTAGLYFLGHIGALCLSTRGDSRIKGDVPRGLVLDGRSVEQQFEGNRTKIGVSTTLDRGDTVTSFAEIGAAPRIQKKVKSASTTIPRSGWRSRGRIGHVLASTTNVARVGGAMLQTDVITPVHA